MSDINRHSIRNRRQFIQTAGAAGALLALNGIPTFRAYAQSSSPIKIGALVPLTGPLANLGETILRGIQHAANAVNESGGVIGREVVVISEDSASKPSVAIDKVKKLHLRDKIDMLTGVVNTSVTFAIQDYIKKEKLLYINSTSGSDDIMLPEHRSKYFFHAKEDHSQSTLPTEYVSKTREPGAKWYFVGSDYAWGHDGVRQLRERAELGNEIEVVGTQFIPLDVSNLAPIVSKIAPTQPDVIAFAVVGQGYPAFIRQVRLFGLKSHLHHDYMSLIEAGGAGSDAIGLTGGISYAMQDPNNPGAERFAKSFYEKYKLWPEMGAVSGATAVNTYLQAVRIAGDVDIDNIVKILETETLDDPIRGPIKYRECDHQLLLPMHLVELASLPDENSDGMRLIHTYATEHVNKVMRQC